jgi:glycosyltransferase involved in cell wall biosynthesis
MRILFVHEVNYMRKVIYEIHDFPELLTMRGHEVTFLDFAEDEDLDGWSRWVDVRTRRVHGVARAHEGASVRVVTPGRIAPPPLDRLVAPIAQLPTLRRELRDGGYDAVVLYGVPTNGWQTVALAHRYELPVLFRSIDVSHELRSSAFRWAIRRAERFIFERADGVSANNVAMRRYAIENGAVASRVSVDYPGLDLARFTPGVRPAVLAERYGIAEDDRVVLFMGTFFRFSGLDWFIDGIGATLRRRPEIKLLLLGGGEAEAELRSRVLAAGLESQVVFTGFIDYPELADHLRLGDVAITPFREELVTHCALPGKMLQYAGCGLPIVSTRLEGIQGLIPEGGGASYREPGAPFVDAVVGLLDHPDERRAAGRAARRTIEQRCSWSNAIEGFEHAILRVVEERAHPPVRSARHD